MFSSVATTCLLAVTSHACSGAWWTPSPLLGLRGLLGFDLLPGVSITHRSARLRPRGATERGWCVNMSSDVPERDSLSDSDVIEEIRQTLRKIWADSACCECLEHEGEFDLRQEGDSSQRIHNEAAIQVSRRQNFCKSYYHVFFPPCLRDSMCVRFSLGLFDISDDGCSPGEARHWFPMRCKWHVVTCSILQTASSSNKSWFPHCCRPAWCFSDKPGGWPLWGTFFFLPAGNHGKWIALVYCQLYLQTNYLVYFFFTVWCITL